MIRDSRRCQDHCSERKHQKWLPERCMHNKDGAIAQDAGYLRSPGEHA